MSTNLSKEISCPKCGRSSHSRMWPVIEAEKSPEQRERILEESLFFWECPECDYQMQLVYPCLYQDMKHHFIVLLDPNQKEQSLDKKAFSAIRTKNIRKRIVSSVEELKEKILIFESGLNDAACELAKLAMGQTIERKKEQKTSAGYFSSADPENNKITFVFRFEDEDLLPLYQTTQFEVYKKTLEITESLHFDPCGSDFLRVDTEMARLMLEEYQNR